MIEILKRYAEAFTAINTIAGILMYWVPLAFCAYGYTVRTWRNYREDVRERREHEVALAQVAPGRVTCSWYSPTDKLGDLVGRAVVTLVPIANIWAAMFDLAPEVFKRVYGWLAKVMNQPVVPPRKEQ